MSTDPPSPAAPLELARVAAQFDLAGAVGGIEPLGNGNVNDTYRVRLVPPGAPSFVLQRLNTRVFPQPELVMANLLTFSEHVARRQRNGCALLSGRRWEVPQVVPARAGGQAWVEAEGAFWRLTTFLDGARSFETVLDLAHAREVGVGLGLFHALISDLSVSDLADTLEGFHITPAYLSQFHRVLGNAEITAEAGLDSELQACLAFVRARKAGVAVLEEAKAAGLLPLRPIHGDPKINNVMIDAGTGQAIALVDLDTVKPGLVHYDIGDCLRSCCNRLGEETIDWRSVRFDPQLCEAVLRGYGSVAGSFLTPHDYDHLFAAIRLIPFELGLRFLTDHLAGNIYFKIQHPRHNLMRALVQFQLTESIEAQEETIQSIVASMR